MPLTQDQEDREHDLRMDQMTVNIEKMRRDMRQETWRIGLQIAAILVAGVAAGVALATYVNSGVSHTFY